MVVGVGAYLFFVAIDKLSCCKQVIFSQIFFFWEKERMDNMADKAMDTRKLYEEMLRAAKE